MNHEELVKKALAQPNQQGVKESSVFGEPKEIAKLNA